MGYACIGQLPGAGRRYNVANPGQDCLHAIGDGSSSLEPSAAESALSIKEAVDDS